MNRVAGFGGVNGDGTASVLRRINQIGAALLHAGRSSFFQGQSHTKLDSTNGSRGTCRRKGEKYIFVMGGGDKRRRSEAESKASRYNHKAVLRLPGCENARGCPCWI